MMQNLDKVDERAKKFFYRAFVGKLTAKNDTGYIWQFCNDDKRLVETETFSIGAKYCSYCGSRALPIQKNIGFGDYEVTGYTCCCSSAMDEVDFKYKLESLKKKQEEDIKNLLKEKPKVNNTVKITLIKDMMTKAINHLDKDEIFRFKCLIDDIKEGV